MTKFKFRIVDSNKDQTLVKDKFKIQVWIHHFIPNLHHIFSSMPDEEQEFDMWTNVNHDGEVTMYDEQGIKHVIDENHAYLYESRKQAEFRLETIKILCKTRTQ